MDKQLSIKKKLRIEIDATDWQDAAVREETILQSEDDIVKAILRENDRLLRRLEIETRLVEWMEKQAPDIFAQSDILMKRIEIGDELRGVYSENEYMTVDGMY